MYSKNRVCRTKSWSSYIYPNLKEATQNGPLNHPNKDTQNLKYTNKRYEIGPLNHPSKDIQKWSP